MMSTDERAQQIAAQMGVNMPSGESPLLNAIIGTVKAVPRVLGTAAGSMAMMPGAGLAGLIELINSGDLNKANSAINGAMDLTNFINTPEQAQSLEYLNLPMKPIQMAGQGWGEIGKATGIPYMEPALGSLGEAITMLSLPGAPKAIKSRAWGAPGLTDILPAAAPATIPPLSPYVDLLDVLTRAKNNVLDYSGRSMADQRGSFNPSSADLPSKGIVYRTVTDRDRLRSDSDWNQGKKDGDMEAARRFASRNWEDSKTAKIGELVDNPENVLYVSQPSSSGSNMHPLALAEKLANDTGASHASGLDYFTARHAEESKAIPPSERVFNPRDYEPINIEELKNLSEGKQVVVVDDFYTSGGSVAAFIRALQNEGIPVKAHVGYFGEARLRPDPQSIDGLQRALRNAEIPIKGGELAKFLTRSEIGGIIRTINQARSENAKQQLTGKLSGILDRGTSKDGRNAPDSSVLEGIFKGTDRSSGQSGAGIQIDPRSSPQSSLFPTNQSRLNTFNDQVIAARNKLKGGKK
jgi:hypothetical protein